jgi:hypothetical protein
MAPTSSAKLVRALDQEFCALDGADANENPTQGRGIERERTGRALRLNWITPPRKGAAAVLTRLRNRCSRLPGRG